MTKAQVKIIAKAFGHRAIWLSSFQEWQINANGEPKSGTYYTNDDNDAIYTVLANYRYRRNHLLIGAMRGE